MFARGDIRKGGWFGHSLGIVVQDDETLDGLLAEVDSRLHGNDNNKVDSSLARNRCPG